MEGGLRSSHPGQSRRSSWEELHACQHGDEARGFIDKGSFSLCFLNLFFDLFSILGEGNSSHSSTLAWRTPWMEQPGRLQSMGQQRLRQD